MTDRSSPSPNTSPAFDAAWRPLLEQLRRDQEQIFLGGGQQAIARQHQKNRLTARERIAALIDGDSSFLELGRFAAWGMYEEWGSAPAASVVCGVGRVADRSFMIIAHDATVQAGAFSR